jgi:hypothetical protein
MTLRSERFKLLKPKDQALERIESLADLINMYELAMKKALNEITPRKRIQEQILDALDIKLNLR